MAFKILPHAHRHNLHNCEWRWKTSITTLHQIEINTCIMAHYVTNPDLGFWAARSLGKGREGATDETSWNHQFKKLIISSFGAKPFLRFKQKTTITPGLTGWQFTRQCVLQPFGAPTEPNFERNLLKSQHDTYRAKKKQQPPVRAFRHRSHHRWSQAIAKVIAQESVSFDMQC